MREKNYSRIFYVETFILLFFFLAVIVIISRVLVGARAESIHARDLTNAVILAEDAAEIARASSDPEEICALFGTSGSGDSEAEATLPMSLELRCGEDLVYAVDGRYLVAVTWDREAHAAGDLVTAQIRVSLFESGEELYTLDTASWLDRSGTGLLAGSAGEGGQS